MDIYDPIFMLAAAGVGLLLAVWAIFQRKLDYRRAAFLNVAGSICICISLLVMSYEENGIQSIRDNLERGLPALNLMIFFALNLNFLMYNCFYRSWGWDKIELYDQFLRRKERWRRKEERKRRKEDL
jgi:hypothetical protein